MHGLLLRGQDLCGKSHSYPPSPAYGYDMDPAAEQAVVSRIITTIFTSDLIICVDAC